MTNTSGKPPPMKRPAIFVPLSVNIATGKTGTALLKAFGAEGIAVWVCFLAACKRNRPPGRIVFASDTEAWITLGLLDVDNSVDARPKFTITDFFKVTGRLKQTRRRRVGRMLDVSCTHFGDWNKTIQTEYERERKARLREESARDTTGTSLGTSPGQNRDLELELERDKSSKQRGVAGDLPQPLAAEPRRLLEHLKEMGKNGAVSDEPPLDEEPDLEEPEPSLEDEPKAAA